MSIMGFVAFTQVRERSYGDSIFFGLIALAFGGFVFFSRHFTADSKRLRRWGSAGFIRFEAGEIDAGLPLHEVRVLPGRDAIYNSSIYLLWRDEDWMALLLIVDRDAIPIASELAKWLNENGSAVALNVERMR
jgi:hypothetical protein